jgi:hypothetical protein
VNARRALPWFFGAVVVAHFVWFAAPGLSTGFFTDDLLNLYFPWLKPWSGLLTDAAFPFRNTHRPFGGLVYRALFDAFGLNPAPYRAVCFCLVSANLAIAFFLSRRLLGSSLAALPAAMLFSFHAYMAEVFYSTTILYDLLSFLFVFGALLWYASIRDAGRFPRWVEWLGLSVLYTFALGSKELSVILPALVVAYELSFHGKPRGRVFYAGMAAPVALTAAFLVQRLAGPSAVATNPAFAMNLSRAPSNALHYAGLLLFQGHPAGPLLMVALGVLVLLCAVLSRAGRFGGFVFLAGSFPVLLIEPRSLYALYLPYFGFCLMCASLPGRIPFAALLVIPLNAYHLPFATRWMPLEQRKAELAISAFRDMSPPLAKGARILVTTDPFDPDDWILTFAAQLTHRDATLEVDRVKRMAAAPADTAGYARVLSVPDPR